MTEKDKDEMQKAQVIAWEIRDGLLETLITLNPATIDAPNSKDAGNAHDKLEELREKANSLIVELVRLSSNAIHTINKLEHEVEACREDIDKLVERTETIERDASSLEDEVAALQEQVTELNAKESES